MELSQIVLMITLVIILAVLLTIGISFALRTLNERKYDIFIIAYEKYSNGYRAVTWRGMKSEIKTEMKEGDIIKIKTASKMLIQKKSGNFSYPDDECFVPKRGLFGGKLVCCTYVNGQVTWLKPSVDFKQYTAFNSNEAQLALQNLKMGYERYKMHKEKPTDIMDVMPWIVLILILGVGVWISFNQYAYMRGSTDMFFNKFVEVLDAINMIPKSLNQTLQNLPALPVI